MSYFDRKGLMAAAVLCMMMGGTAVAQAAQVPFTDPQKPQQSFDQAWAHYEKVRGPDTMMARMERSTNAKNRLLSRMALDIFEGYPNDPRRWNAALEIIRNVGNYLSGKDPTKTGFAALRWDEPGKAAWIAYVKALYQQLLAQPDLPKETIKAGISSYFGLLVDTRNTLPTELVLVLDEYARRFPDEPQVASYAGLLYMRMLESATPDVVNDWVQKELQSPNAGMRKFAEAKMLTKIGRGKPFDMKFTALDGREVDLAKLRGKVVLIDFWATWCGPCMQEVPHVKKLYDENRQQGFEVIGVSLDASGNPGKPSAEDKSPQQLLAFLKQHNMTWPNYYDGKAWKNELAVKYAVKTLPTKLLLDKDGMLVAVNLTGDKLDAKVKELLAQKPGTTAHSAAESATGASMPTGAVAVPGGVSTPASGGSESGVIFQKTQH